MLWQSMLQTRKVCIAYAVVEFCAASLLGCIVCTDCKDAAFSYSYSVVCVSVGHINEHYKNYQTD